jgi:hypothetical protein
LRLFLGIGVEVRGEAEGAALVFLRIAGCEVANAPGLVEGEGVLRGLRGSLLGGRRGWSGK